MTALGGVLAGFSWGGRDFSPSNDANVSMELGGDSVETMSNGNKTVRNIVTPVPGSMSGISLEIDHAKKDLEFLTENKRNQDCTATFQDGTTYQSGDQTINGEIKYDAATATCTIEIKGTPFKQF